MQMSTNEMKVQFIPFLLLSLLICSVKCCPHGWNPSFTDATKCYFVGQATMTWQDAENYCRTLGPNSHLTSILSAFETSEINAIVANNAAIGSLDQIWIGAKGSNDDSRFFWTDGSPFVYHNWLAGQPNLNFPCVSSLAKSSGRWDTESCEMKNYVVCKYIMMPTKTPTDCYDYYFNEGNSTDGIYRISPPGIDPFDVWCDMTTDGGGWTVFQKRIDDSEDFYLHEWSDYKSGFNNGLKKNLWLGLDRINVLSTKDANNVLRIDLFGNRCNQTLMPSGFKCETAVGPNAYFYSEWPSFSVEDERNKYRLHVSHVRAGNISSNTYDYLFTYHNNQSFSTIDVNNCGRPDSNCASIGEFGAYWFNFGCGFYGLNGQYNHMTSLGGFHVIRGLDHEYNLDGYIIPFRSEMKMRKMFA